MKRILVMVAVALMATMSVNAQNEELRHEVSVAYGGPSLSQFGSGLGEGLGLAFTNSEYDDGNIFGPISAEYFYHPNNPRLAVGGIITYSKWDSDVLRRSNHNDKLGERNRNYLSVMPGIKWYWVNKNSFGFYSKAAAGPMFVFCKSEDYESNKSLTQNGTYFLFQCSPIGIEFGGKFRGFAEIGLGEQGVLLGGLRYKF
jgi:hypothetical protein